MQCNRCEQTAAYTRRYSGESLCSSCFSGYVVRKTAKTISKYDMIGRGQRVAVAVSGGKDSLALLHVLAGMARSHSFEIRAVTIDEGISGYREEALDIVKKYCTGLAVPYDIFSYKKLFNLTLEQALAARNDGTSSCSICGTLRRRAIDHAAASVDADVVATAHNLDDNIQTHLINMLSGDIGKIGRQGPRSGSDGPARIKPFCEIYEKEIVFYAFVNNIPFQTEPCPHMGEGIRTSIREFLNSLEEDRPGIKNNMYRSMTKISEIVGRSHVKPQVRCRSCGALCTSDRCGVCGVISKYGRLQT